MHTLHTHANSYTHTHKHTQRENPILLVSQPYKCSTQRTGIFVETVIDTQQQHGVCVWTVTGAMSCDELRCFRFHVFYVENSNWRHIWIQDVRFYLDFIILWWIKYWYKYEQAFLSLHLYGLLICRRFYWLYVWTESEKFTLLRPFEYFLHI